MDHVSPKEAERKQQPDQIIAYPTQEAFVWDNITKFLGNAREFVQGITTVNQRLIPGLLDERIRVLFVDFVDNVYKQYMSQIMGIVAPVEMRDRPSEEIALVFKTKGYIADNTSFRGVKRKNNPISMEKYHTSQEIVGYEIQIPEDKLDGGIGEFLIQEELRAAAASINAASEYALARALMTMFTCSVVRRLFEKNNFQRENILTMWERYSAITGASVKEYALSGMEEIHRRDQVKTTTNTRLLLIGSRTQSALRKSRENSEARLYGNNNDGAENKLSGLKPIEQISDTTVKVLVHCETPDFYSLKNEKQAFDMTETVSIHAGACIISPTPNIDYTTYSSKEDYIMLQNYKTEGYDSVTQQWAFEHANIFGDAGIPLDLKKEDVANHFMYDPTSGKAYTLMKDILNPDSKSATKRIIALGDCLYGKFLEYSGLSKSDTITALKSIRTNPSKDHYDTKKVSTASKVIGALHEFMTGYYDIPTVDIITKLILFFNYDKKADNTTSPTDPTGNTDISGTDQAKVVKTIIGWWSNYALAPYLVAIYLFASFTKKNIQAGHRLGTMDPFDYIYARTRITQNTESALALAPNGGTVYRTMAMPLNEIYKTKETGDIHIGYEVHIGVHPANKENFHMYPHVKPYKYIGGGEIDFEPHTLSRTLQTEERVSHFVIPIPADWKPKEPLVDFSGCEEMKFAAVPGIDTYIKMYHLGAERGMNSVIFGLTAHMLRVDYELDLLRPPIAYVGKWEPYKRARNGTVTLHKGTGPLPDPVENFTYYSQ